MIRLTLILAVLIVVAMIVLAPDENAPQVVADATDPGTNRPHRIDLTDDALVETGDGRLVLVTTDGEELPIDLVIEPASLTEEDARVNLPPAETSGALEPVLSEDTELPPETAETAETAETVAPPAQLPAETGTLLRVTGDRVNFRAGPSTEDAILAALALGTQVELIERVGDGWAHLRVLETDLSGYMSEDFLEPVN
jgi:hypothetical protein